MRTASAAFLFVALIGISAVHTENAAAQDRVRKIERNLARASAASDVTQLRRRPRVRIYRARGSDDVYPRFNPGPNAVRDCTATYVQEFRQSGTVIVPRMSCYWRQP